MGKKGLAHTGVAVEKQVLERIVKVSEMCIRDRVNRQIKNEVLEPVLKYGILKERMAALMTDGIRANLLESMGYETQILEFIDMEHTPKNLLIRAVKTGKPKDMKSTVPVSYTHLYRDPPFDPGDR